MSNKEENNMKGNMTWVSFFSGSHADRIRNVVSEESSSLTKAGSDGWRLDARKKTAVLISCRLHTANLPASLSV